MVRLTSFLPALVFACLATAASAAVLVPGDTVRLSGTTSDSNPDLAGRVIHDRLRPFEIRNNLGNVILSGQLQERVLRSHNTERLIFAPRIRDLVNPAGDAWVMSMTYAGFEDMALDVDYRLDVLGNVGPNDAFRSNDGDSVRFRHDPNLILPPDSQRFLSIQTPTYEMTRLGAITISAQNDFGASVFDTTIRQVPTPAFAGDANLDGVFDSSDMVEMFRAGEYHDGVPDNSTWAEGDFNNDREFTSADLVLALRTGRYLGSEARGASAIHPVPEPGTIALLISGLLASSGRWRKDRNRVV